MKKINLLISLLFVVGCASSSKKSADVDTDNNYTESTMMPTTDDNTEVTKADYVKPSSTLEDALVASLKKQNESDIIKNAQDILLVNPNHDKALNALSLVYYKKGQFKAAEYFNVRALKANSNSSALLNNTGLIQLAQGKQREAIASFKKGLELNSKDVAIAANLGSLYVANKDYLNGEIALESVVKSGTKDTKILNNYAIALSANKKYAEATAIYEKALSDNPSARDIMLNYSIHLIENLKQNQKGLDLINRLKFVGVPNQARNLIKDLENKAKTGLK